MTGRPVVALVGAGHAHLHVADRAAEFAAAGFDLVLVDPGRFWYSSMATGLLGGEYEADDDSLDPHALIAARGGRSVRASASGIDRANRIIRCDDGRTLRYDLVSLNVGSGVPRALGDTPIPDDVPRVWSAKPIPRLLDLRRALEGAWSEDPAAIPRAIVIGLGLGGAELALNLDALARRRRRQAAITVLGGDAPETSVTRRLQHLLERRGIAVRPAAIAAAARRGELDLEGGETLAFDHLVLATGLRAHSLVAGLGLDRDETGALHVTPELRAPDDERVFAAGDCAAILGHPRPKVGVFGVRAAPVLANNLLAAATGGRLRAYRPQRRWLWVANLGDGTGLAAWGGTVGTAPDAALPGGLRPGLMWRGRTALWIKRAIDRRFMGRYRVPRG